MNLAQIFDDVLSGSALSWSWLIVELAHVWRLKYQKKAYLAGWPSAGHLSLMKIADFFDSGDATNVLIGAFSDLDLQADLSKLACGNLTKVHVAA